MKLSISSLESSPSSLFFEISSTGENVPPSFLFPQDSSSSHSTFWRCIETRQNNSNAHTSLLAMGDTIAPKLAEPPLPAQRGFAVAVAIFKGQGETPPASLYALCVGVDELKDKKAHFLRGGRAGQISVSQVGLFGLGHSSEGNDSSFETPSQCLPNRFMLSKGSPSHKWTPSALPPSAATQLQSWNSRSFLQMRF